MGRRTPNTSEAWTWRHAFSAAKLHATTKLLLHTVGMFMNDMGNGSFPSQAEIIEYSSLDKKTVIKHTRIAIEAGWLAAFQHGYRGQKWRRLEYKPCWPDRDLVAAEAEPDLSEGGGDAPPPSDGVEVVDLGAEGGGIGGSKVVEEVHQDKTFQNFPDSLPKGRAQARPGVREEHLDRNAEKQFWRIVKTWPGFDGMPKEAAKPHFLALDQASRDAAERKQPGWLALLKAQGKDHVPAPSTYFRERLFDVVDDPLDGPKPPVEARPFGKLWAALRMRRLLSEPVQAMPPPPRLQVELLAEDSERGRQARLDRQAAHGWPQVNFMHEQAANRKGVTAPAAEEGLGDLCEAVHVGSDLRAAWKDAHRARGWPWPSEFDRVEWVYFPAGGPDGLAEFERAVRGTAEGVQADRPSAGPVRSEAEGDSARTGNDGDRQQAAE